MNIEIRHGIPKHQFFVIAQPKRQYNESRLNGEKKPIVILTDPVSGNITTAELYDIWTLKEEFEEMNGLAYLAYGCDAKTLKKELINRYPELQTNFVVEYWLMKKNNIQK